MSNSFLDTNVLVRFLVGDIPRQQVQAEQWFKQAEQGKRSIMVSALVIAETVFVLESFYKQSRDSIADALEVFVGQRWLRVEEREVLLQLWPWYRKGLHFVDSYLRAIIGSKGGEILSFDKKLLKS